MSSKIILIDLPLQRRWMRYVFGGMSAYARKHTHWRFTFSPELQELGELTLTRHPPDAVIGVKPNPHTESLPAVWLSPDHHPGVINDYEAIGALACDHLVDRGFRHLAAFTTGETDKTELHRRVKGFRMRAAELGAPCRVFTVGPRTRKLGRWRLEDQIADLIDFIRDQPRPLGLIGCDVPHTLRALNACREADLSIPDDLALMCPADDELMFTHTQPGISAVVHDQERLGWEAAKLLHAILENQPHPEQVKVPPVMVAARGSTDWTAVADPFCAGVLKHIRSHLDESLKVADLAHTFHVSESTLVRRFKSRLGKTPIQEITHARIEVAKSQLLTTDTPLVHIAFNCGFSSQPHFQREFKKATGMTPGQMRKAHGTVL